MSSDRIKIVWIYPDLLSTYGDQGNTIVLERRAALRGIQTETINVRSDQAVPQDGDIYLLGGGEDRPQILAAHRLRRDGGLPAAARRGAVVFGVCAGYQLLGHEFGGEEGQPVQGLGLLDIHSNRGEQRAVGEIVGDVSSELQVPRITGFENHQGVTHLGQTVKPFAQVVAGIGNGNGFEGAYSGRVLGTYMHGPALVRNPGLADLLLRWAAGRDLRPIDDSWAGRLREERLNAVVPAT
ncbi:type 1 glutamine amidotransferase [Spirillospora sp. CA-294931]|uniref:type 1 glutamine amidotransferase n=1 Tax=Spirillospora sp. CA-294931 TaxID=3240042 RepID=UPI003D8FB44A